MLTISIFRYSLQLLDSVHGGGVESEGPRGAVIANDLQPKRAQILSVSARLLLFPRL